MTTPKKSCGPHGWDVATRLLQWVLVPIMAFLALQVWGNSNSLAMIQGNRFTSDNGLEVWQEISSIRQDIKSLPQESPPDWFVNKVHGLELRLITLQEEVTAIRIQLAENSNKE